MGPKPTQPDSSGEGKKAAAASPAPSKKATPATKPAKAAQPQPSPPGLLPPWLLRPVSTVPDYYHVAAVGVLTILALAFRFYRLEYPDEIVFDEIYFAGFASHYIKREHFFDIHPPLGKLTFALIGWLFGHDGNFPLKHIGEKFNFPQYYYMRASVALLGSLHPAMAYLTTREITGSFIASLLAGISVLLDLSLLISSRVILTDTFLYMYQALGIFLLFKQYRCEPLTRSWILYLVSSSFFFGAALSVKWTVLGLLGIFAFRHIYYLWEIFPHLSFKNFRKVVGFYVLAASIAVGIYMFSFYMHFAVSTKTGPGDPYHGGDDRYLVEFEGSPASQTYKGPRLSFLSKFSILHKVMYSANSGVQEHHASGSRWLNWPVNEVGVFSWTKYADGTVAMIYLAGNPAIWWTCLAAFAVWPFYIAYRLFISKSQISDLDETRLREGFTLLVAHLVSWVPFALIKRSQFIYHYIPAFYLTVLITSILLDFWLRSTPRSYIKIVIFLTVIYSVAFWYWSAWCYGYPQTYLQQDHRRWIATWM